MEDTIYTPDLDPRELEFTPDVWSEAWTAETVANHLRANIRYLPERSVFLTWNGHVWQEDKMNLAPYWIGKALVWLANQAGSKADTAPGEQGKEARRFQRAAQTQAFKARIARLVSEHPSIVTAVDHLDPKASILNTPAGMADLFEGSIIPSSPEAMCSMVTAVAPEDGTPTQWIDFLSETFQGDAETIRFIQRWLGYLATGQNEEKYLLVGVGRTDSGKSVFNDVVSRIFGTYHANIPSGALLAQSGNRHPADLASFVTARVATGSEVPSGGGRWRAAELKQITGGDQLSVRKMRENFYDVTPRCRIMLFSNHTPGTGNDSALRRRILLVPFPHSVPLEMQDKHLRDRLVENEGGKILSWIIQGARQYLRSGLGDIPDAIQRATAEYKAGEDLYAQFIEDECEVHPEYSDSSRNLFRAWGAWCRENGISQEDKGQVTGFTRAWNREVAEDYGLTYSTHAFDSATGKRARGFLGIRVRPPDVFSGEDPADRAVAESRRLYAVGN